MSASSDSEPVAPPVLLLPVSYRHYGNDTPIRVALAFTDADEMTLIMAALEERP